ncbi:MAG: hypothetical protein Q8K02_08520 [Flavobacterium sp.]|nr:hypothetical protein [Flavobacterium sp.]
MEVRAFDIERWFGNEKRNEEFYQDYLETDNKKVKNYQIKNFPIFSKKFKENNKNNENKLHP